MIASHKRGAELFREMLALFALLVGKDRSYLFLAIIYGLAISLLTLSVPISVQMLINSVMHTASATAVSILALILLVLLVISGVLSALQTYVMELFERRFYARISAEFTLRNIHADHNHYRHINRYELVNRFFDIMNVQKVVPNLVIGMFTIVLQMFVGIVLVSFYHPWLLLFSTSFVLILWLIWRIWGYRAFRTSIELSDAKYSTARHLEDVARNNDFFKAGTAGRFAVARADRLMNDYIRQRERHFANTFSQKIGLLVLYALSSAGLLGLGGLLVIHNELTIGQLVAAELILSAVFFGISRLDNYLVQIYELGASLEEISRIFHVPQEHRVGKRRGITRNMTIAFNDAQYRLSTPASDDFQLNLHLMPGEKLMAVTSSYVIQQTLVEALQGYITTTKGELLIGAHNALDYDMTALRDAILVIDRPTVIECTILEYLRMFAPQAGLTELHDALEKVELRERIEHLEEGMHTLLTPIGLPLSSAETLRLKLASAWLARPRLLVLNELYDSISYHRRQRIFRRLQDDPELGLLYFSNRHDLDYLDGYLYIEPTRQMSFDRVDAFREYEVRS